MGGAETTTLAELYELYREIAPQTWWQLLNAYSVRDQEMLKISVSSLESSSELIGAKAFADLMKGLLNDVSQPFMETEKLRQCERVLELTLTRLDEHIDKLRQQVHS